MNTLIQTNGLIRYGHYSNPVDLINYEDFDLKTSSGISVHKLVKKLLFKQFIFVGITGPELIAGLAVVDLKYITNGFFYVYNRRTGKLWETKHLGPGSADVYIRPLPEKIDSRYQSRKLSICLKNDKISARGDGVTLNATLNLNKPRPLRLCTRTGYRGWSYTQKTAPIEISGEIRFKNTRISVSSPDCLALIDWTAGYMRRNTFWNWAAAASSLPDNRTLGLNLACGVNETGFTENTFWLDNRITRTGPVNFVFNKDDLYSDWRITSGDRKINLVFTPESGRKEKVNALVVASDFTQLMGVFKGNLTADDGEVITISGCSGWVEDHFAKW
ncbi:DUF2804 domain-containing protein [Desulfococcaceae bacterium HSG9]|nr:DUF2804 domain-containing protein [Desulfococcaceae bacterium HSG9]